MNLRYKATQYACAVLLIISSIALAYISALGRDDIPDGVLMYIAQAFLLAGSIFGLDYYVHKVSQALIQKNHESEESKTDSPRNTEQQPT